MPNIQGVKESSGNLQQIAELIQLLPLRSFAVLAGDDLMALPVIAFGGAGLISVASNEDPQRDGAHGGRGVRRRLEDRSRTSTVKYFRLMTANFSGSRARDQSSASWR